MSKVIITGGSGFIGRHIRTLLLQKGYQVVVIGLPSTKGLVLGLHPPKGGSQPGEFIAVDLTRKNLPPDLFEGAEAIIHLVGANIFGRWSKEKKKAIYESRVAGTRNLVTALEKVKQKPRCLISASAVGIYGDRAEEELFEESLPGQDFLARACVDWEKEANRAQKLGIRAVQIRTAPVLGDGGLLQKLLPLYKLCLGGPIASGRQWFPWVHIQDIVGIYFFAMENERVEGSLNAVAPEYVTNKDFSGALAQILKKSAFFPVQKWQLKLLFGDLADAITASQKVSSKKLTDLGYQFAFPNLRQALENIVIQQVAR